MGYTDIMLDLETFGTSNDAAIVSIGAVAFNADKDFGYNAHLRQSPDDLWSVGTGFKVGIDLSRSKSIGTIDASTVEWWLKQSNEARESLWVDPRLTLEDALHDLIRWAARWADPRPRLWSNGPTFDEVILRSACQRQGVELPISFLDSRCCRTMRHVAEMHGWNGCPYPKDDIIAHCALSDALHQARSVVDQIQFLKGV